VSVGDNLLNDRGKNPANSRACDSSPEEWAGKGFSAKIIVELRKREDICKPQGCDLRLKRRGVIAA
jgi:hypothetical protein